MCGVRGEIHPSTTKRSAVKAKEQQELQFFYIEKGGENFKFLFKRIEFIFFPKIRPFLL